jgi:hypothetical protein
MWASSEGSRSEHKSGNRIRSQNMPLNPWHTSSNFSFRMPFFPTLILSVPFQFVWTNLCRFCRECKGRRVVVVGGQASISHAYSPRKWKYHRIGRRVPKGPSISDSSGSN